MSFPGNGTAILTIAVPFLLVEASNSRLQTTTYI